MDTDGFMFTTQWHETDEDGLVRDYAAQHFSVDLQQARRFHGEACRGMWVKRETLRPHVSALRVWKWGRILEEELAVGVSRCDVHGVWSCGVCEDRRREAA